MRLRYIEKNHLGAATLLMLHDLAEQSTVFIKVGMIDDFSSFSLFSPRQLPLEIHKTFLSAFLPWDVDRLRKNLQRWDSEFWQ